MNYFILMNVFREPVSSLPFKTVQVSASTLHASVFLDCINYELLHNTNLFYHVIVIVI